MRRWLESPSADPSRVHAEGREVRAAIEEAREQVAGALGVRPRQVVFTSGATEAINSATWGVLFDRPGGAIVCSRVEHSAVRESAERMGPVVELSVDGAGRIDLEDLGAAIERTPTVALAHCQWGNHEMGTVQPVAAFVERCHEAEIPVHVDAAAAFGHVPLTGLGAKDGPDLVSVSAQKMGGPPGVGALVLRRGLRIEPLLLGGQQERGRRAGMENVVGIVGFGAAAEAVRGSLEEEGARARAQTERLAEVVLAEDDTVQVGDAKDRLPHIVCFGVKGVEAEPVLLGLDRAGVAAHSGSACSSESLEPSPVLEAMGADPSHSLRLSVGWSTTDGDVKAFEAVFGSVVSELRALR